MRSRIYQNLTELHNAELEEVEKIISNFNQNIEYEIKNVKGRDVINNNEVEKDLRIVLDYYKEYLNRYAKLKFPNRSSIMSEVMNIMPNIHVYHTYTIFKFDIEKFFYNIDFKKIRKYIDDFISLHSHEKKFFEVYTKNQKELIPGVGLHNSMMEILGHYFDMKIKEKFEKHCIYYARYVDDGIIIFDEEIDELEIKNEVSKLLKNIFGENVKLSQSKTKCYKKSFNGKIDFEYLGYHFLREQGKKFKFGIANSKIQKYQLKIDEYIEEYVSGNQDEEAVKILDFKIDALFKRVVYYGTSKNSTVSRWQVRGISDSYKELKRFMDGNSDVEKITKNTFTFFEKYVGVSFGRIGRNRIEIPRCIRNKLKNKRYLANFYKNRTILMHPNLGWKYDKLQKCMEEIYKLNTINKSYETLAKEFLIHYK
ncbi:MULTISPECIES: reverse transcriptase domain-containing protein [unclassified Exiguobacterium]|uniref:reverse transcriptase domain-containing protein n=1 Tax=unclassified Exiguobacterium TaxID=2644629 RepID=UPI001BED1060|nr:MULTISPECIES: reverse transcriptase domain-containing protein [unclassified Exiguobacterium]